MRKIWLAVLLCLALCSCAKTEYKKSIFAMDTVMDLTVYGENEDALLSAEAEIKRIDALLDRGNESSEIYQINNKKTAEVSSETAELIKTAVGISEKTDGAFDITTASVTDLWGFYGGNFRVPTDSELKTALYSVGYEKIQLDGRNITIPENSSIDLGGIGKGYASDRVMEVLKNNGAKSAVISLGGNVRTLGKKPNGQEWKIGITDPMDKSQLLGTVSVCDSAVVTSGGYQRYFEADGVTYHHIIDPETGKCAQSGLASVTIIAKSGTVADGLSTALFVMGLDKAAEFWREDGSFEAVFVDDGGDIYVTAGIADTFSSGKNYSVISTKKEKL